ncbi:MAG: hypothetical protein WCC58_04975 [Burkholderiales bacterium]
MKKFLFIAFIIAAGSVRPAHAVGSNADISIYDRTENKVLPVYQHHGKYYVAGKPGNEYQIRVRNQMGQDFLAVTSVDGVNVLSGETAGLNQRGYIFYSGDGYDIMGWRKSNEQVASFYFTSLPDSYAARTGRPDNVGVIGVALFRRKNEAPPISYSGSYSYDYPEGPSMRRESKAADASSTAQSDSASGTTANTQAAESRADSAGRIAHAPILKEKSLGTGHGRTVDSSVQAVKFERASSTPDEIISIYYDSHRNLISRGVIPYTPPIAVNPFPNQFVPDPPRRW